MKRNLFLLICFWAFALTTHAQSTCTDCSKLVIASAIEPPAAGAAAIQLCAIDDIADLSVYSVHRESSSAPGNADLHEGSFTFPAVALSAGACVWIGITDANFSAYFGFSADYYDDSSSGANAAYVGASTNAYLICLGTIEDQYGPGSGIGSGTPEYYNDGWFIRNPGVCPNGGNFSVSDFSVSGANATDGSATASEAGYTPLTSYSASACNNLQACGGVELCGIFYSCNDDVFTAHIPYVGMDATAAFTAESGNLDFSIGDDPASVADGVIQFEVGTSIWGFSLGTACGGVQRYGKRPTGGCAEYSCLWGGQKGPSCDDNGNLIIRLDPFGAGIGTQGYSIAPSDNVGTVTPTTATYGAVTEFTASGYTVGAGSMASFTITDIENGCTLDVPVLDACNEPEPTCDDNIQNGDEEGVDCGGSCANPCPACDDNIQNGDEEGVDCGGSNCQPCPTCASDAECDDGVACTDDTCNPATGCINAPNDASCDDGDIGTVDTCDPVAGCTNIKQAIPTMGQWGLILLMLLTLTFGSLFITASQTTFAGGFKTNQFSFRTLSQWSSYPFDKNIFRKAVYFTACLILLATVGTLAVYGYIAMIDVLGTMITAPIFAYLVHLLMLTGKQNQS